MTPLQQLRDLWQALQAGRQDTRLLRLSFPDRNGPAALLLVNRLAGVESLSRDFEFTVELLSDSATIPLEALQGKLLCVSLVGADGGLRPFTGYVSRCRLVRTDGGVAFYEALLVPWFGHLALRRNNRLFHGHTLQEQLLTIFRDHGTLPRMDWQVRGDEARVTMATQWAETDHNYVCRRLEAAGFSYRYDHAQDGHTLVVQGTTLDAPPIAGASPVVRFHAEGGPLDLDGVSRWSPVRPWASAHAAVSAFDFKRPRPEHADVPGIDRQGDVPRLEVHRYEGHYGFRPDRGGDALARLRIEEIEARDGKRFEAEGNCSRIAAGHWFRLGEHFAHAGDDADFLVLEVHHAASNNHLQAVGAPAEYRNRFVCQRKGVPWRPGEGFNSTPTRLLSVQTAIVTGPDGAGSLHVDEHGRVRLRFHWDRSGSSSCWVRVASPWAGGKTGSRAIPGSARKSSSNGSTATPTIRS